MLLGVGLLVGAVSCVVVFGGRRGTCVDHDIIIFAVVVVAVARQEEDASLCDYKV